MRARSIKPGFFKNCDLADAGPRAQLLFAGLWCLADKEGRLKDQPRVIKAEVFPYYDCDVNSELTVIEQLGLIRRYEVSGIAVIEVLNFKKHQSPHHTERGSELPPYEQISARRINGKENHAALTVSPPLENGGNPSDSLTHDSLTHDSLTHEQKPPSACPSPGRPPKAKAAFPADLKAPSESMRSRAVERYPDCDVNEMFTQFRAHHISHDSRLKDWELAWVTWLGNAAKFGYPRKRINGAAVVPIMR